jgi:hypothetical protein
MTECQVGPKIFSFCAALWLLGSPRNEKLILLVQIKFLCLHYIYIYLNKIFKIYWSQQSFTGLGPEDQCLS